MIERVLEEIVLFSEGSLYLAQACKEGCES